MRDRVRLLVEHGVDFRTLNAAPGGRPTALPSFDGLTSAELAKLSGYPELAWSLVSCGAAPTALNQVNSLIAAVLAADGTPRRGCGPSPPRRASGGPG